MRNVPGGRAQRATILAGINAIANIPGPNRPITKTTSPLNIIIAKQAFTIEKRLNRAESFM